VLTVVREKCLCTPSYHGQERAAWKLGHPLVGDSQKKWMDGRKFMKQQYKARKPEAKQGLHKLYSISLLSLFEGIKDVVERPKWLHITPAHYKVETRLKRTDNHCSWVHP
jgi:hypothetical protein